MKTEKTQPVIQLNDIFWTFQGEGVNWGRRSLFIRLPFCNYACPWCDTDYNSINYKLDEVQFKEWLDKEPAKLAIITGGEPTVNKHFQKICEMLTTAGFEIAIETNGSKIPMPCAGMVDMFTVSPKKYAPRDLPEFYIDEGYIELSQVNPERVEFKWVVEEGFDFALVDELYRRSPNARIALSPEFNRMEESMKEIEAYIMREPRARYSLQTHKWIDVK